MKLEGRQVRQNDLERPGDYCFPHADDADTQTLMWVCPCWCGTSGSIKFKGRLSNPRSKLRTLTKDRNGPTVQEPFELRCGSYRLTDGVWTDG
jgi:hypothetical protein